MSLEPKSEKDTASLINIGSSNEIEASRPADRVRKVSKEGSGRLATIPTEKLPEVMTRKASLTRSSPASLRSSGSSKSKRLGEVRNRPSCNAISPSSLALSGASDASRIKAFKASFGKLKSTSRVSKAFDLRHGPQLCRPTD